MLHRLTGLCLAAFLAAGCDVKVGEGGFSIDIAEGKVTDEWVRHYTLGDGGRLDIVNVNGTIVASPSTGNQVEVKAVREARSNSDEAARALLTKVQMVEDVGPDHVKVEARGDWNQRSFGHSQLSVNFTVLLPQGLTVNLKTENGGVRVENVRGRITASTTNGGITGRDVSGSVNAHTVNGGVQMGLVSVNGDVELSVVNGGIRLEVPTNLNAQLEISAVNGGVSVERSLGLASSQQDDRRRISGTLNKGGPRITATATNGGVRVAAR